VPLVYRWQGSIQEERGSTGLFKTPRRHRRALIARIAELHSYDVPAASVWPIERPCPLMRTWVTQESGWTARTDAAPALGGYSNI
jgi:periplasmic divalent cation tolerance protein